MVLLLILQSALLCIGFITLLLLFRSAIVSMVLSIAYQAVALILPWSRLPILVQYNSLWQDLPTYYFSIRAGVLAIELFGLLIIKRHKLLCRR